MKKNFLLLLFTILVLLILSEIFVRIFFPQSLQRYWVINEKEYGLIVNKKNYYYKLHRLKNIKASYTFGDFGNRKTEKSETIEKRPRVLVLGDSFTFGWLLKDEWTYVHKLQLDNLNYEFINPSVGAWGSSAYTLFTELNCNKIMPKKIIVFLNTDDIYRGYHNQYYKPINEGIVKNRIHYSEINKLSKLDKKIPFYLFLKKNSHFFLLTRNLLYNFLNPKPKFENVQKYYYPHPHFKVEKEKFEKIDSLNRKIFIRLKQVTEKCGAELLVIYTGWANIEEMSSENPNKYFLQNASEFFRSNKIKYYDPSNKMSSLYKNPMKYVIDIDLHPNKKGAELIYLSVRKTIKNFLY